MELVENIDKIEKPYKNAVITIGNFDGIHIGHQALFHAVIEKADTIGGTSIVMTFDPHPVRVLKQNGHLPLITLNEQKIELIENSGIDVLICIQFNKAFAAISAKEFVEDLLLKCIGMKAIVVGKDYTFGRNREGNLELLQTFADNLEFEVIVADWVQTSRGLPDRISSTRTRELVMAGEVADAKKLLGRYYQIRGVVTTGRNRGGKLLGFPTANITLHDELCPKNGVYAVTVDCMEKKYQGVANIGYSPTFDDGLFSVEVHILDFNENIYGKKIRVNFVQRIRDEIKFSDITELSDAIRKDIEKARKILS
ncbi:MAG: bifunctional riboflavin kinase/FAD synthetase [Deltaproteobacteria bacterium]|nr:bifunctional riboflavin kinase/FAD synthetase [Deltaproteobacteria bacterium]MBW1747539.1 bifunctional riboflavin kinase/FAD synthetase [Deltaproteobacteria bacterium]MBW1968743.1 bifunctional riboflavin kinase/FAD synthetase [Deltaproteobacteria bacterium]MBW2155030.1 bifunctional riboflavin kinase/FAD synthetase [Deltaproteobacteria bacterium]MBW2324882.1 bifunctional riboflavin kinase/FAD synthetase [Deltaproteobacteria bacterium]